MKIRELDFKQLDALGYSLPKEEKKTVFVGLSGGVDSSVAALRLLREGYEVVGVFIKVWHPDFLVCNWEEERVDAMRVAAFLDIPFLTCDSEAEYQNDVANYFIKEYERGRTPNPDVMCNRYVKFGSFLKFAKDRGADFIATGHYVQRIDKEEENTDGEKVKKAGLYRGVDDKKDQSYFLWTLSKEQLEFSLFPVGNSTKEEIRQEALEAGLPTAVKKDSQGICFLGHIDIPEFISHFVDLKVGEVLNENGEIIGSHKGAIVYTIGQRHGFLINEKNDQKGVHYVIAKDLEKNTITVSTKRILLKKQAKLVLNEITLREDLKTNEIILAEGRYRQKPFLVKVEEVSAEKIILSIAEEQSEMLALGQSCVLYRGNLCLGGGIINECI